MQRTPKHIDELLRERLYDAAPPPPAFVWDNIERSLQKRKRRFFIWFLSFGIAGAVILGVWSSLATNAKRDTASVEHKLTKTEPRSLDETTSLEKPIADLKNGPIVAKTAFDKPIPPYAKQANITLKENSTPEPGKMVKPAQPLVLQKVTTASALEAMSPKTIFEGRQIVAGFSMAKLPQAQRSYLQSLVPDPKATDLLQQSWPETLKSHPAKRNAKTPVKNCYDFSKQPSAWLVDAYFGPSLAQRELVSNLDDRPYLNKRLNTEKRDVAFNAGIRASLMLKGNFLLRTGLQYDQMTEVFEYIDPDYVKYLVEITNQNGMTTIDTVGVEYGEKYQKTYNRFGMLDIPVAVGVEFRKGHSGFNINAGVSLNVMFWKRGAILSPDTGDPAWFTPGTGTLDVFRPRAGLSASASMQWFYHVTPRMRIFVEPYFKKIMRPVTLSSHPVDQRYGIAGLRFGVSKILN